MFAYCLNNPSNRVDENGKDAVAVLEPASAGCAGHVGLFIQDADGNWFYFFWGPADLSIEGTVDIITGEDVLHGAYLIPVDIQSSDFSDINSVKSALEAAFINANISEKQYRDRVDNLFGLIYYEGDYSASYDSAKGYVNSSIFYNLYDKNCFQVSSSILSVSNNRISKIQENIVTGIIPNIGFPVLYILHKVQGIINSVDAYQNAA